MQKGLYGSPGMERLRHDHQLRAEVSRIFLHDVRRALRNLGLSLPEDQQNELLLRLLGTAYKMFLMGYNLEKIAC